MATDVKRKTTTTASKPSQPIINKAVKEAVAEALDGIGTEKFTCSMCGKLLPKNKFYKSTDPLIKTGVSAICKECAKDIALQKDEKTGQYKDPTKESICLALERLDRPFLQDLYESSVREAANSFTGKNKTNVWASYIKNVAMPQYSLLRWKNSDTEVFASSLKEFTEEKDELPKDQVIREEFEKNKKDTLRLLGYLPFDKEKLADQPFLYSQLIGFLDSSEEGNDDMMRTSSIISIVRGFLQQTQIDDRIAEIMSDPMNFDKNVATYKSLQAMKKDLTATITKLAEQSCISLKNSKTTTKGENTWTGKLKKIKDLNLRDYAINGYDIETCKGMQQVADISVGAIIKNLNFDDSEWSDMVAMQTQTIKELESKEKAYEEACRLLLRENLDLRDTLEKHELLSQEQLMDLNMFVNDYIMSGGVVDEKTS